MKRSTPYLLLAGLILLFLTIIVLAPSQPNPVVALEEAIITATLGPTRVAEEDEDGIVYANEVVSLATDATVEPLVVAQVIVLPTATRTPTPINIGNFVWDDLNANGVQNAGEPGMSGVIVQLWNSAKNDLIASTTTGANGSYTVVAPLPGDYRLRVVLPNLNDQFTLKDATGDTADSDINPTGTNLGFTDIFNIASNVISITSKDAGIIRYKTPTPTRTPTPINIGNFVWDDLNANGVQNAGEPGMSGVIVQLWNSAKNNMIATTITSASGSYLLVAPVPGDYRIRVVLPNSNDLFTVKDATGDTADSDINPSGVDAGFTDIFNLASNVISITSKDAGIIRYKTPTPTRTPTPINVGNLVWNDLNDNGLQDGNEPGLGGISVQLWNSAKTQLIGQTVTNANGNYTLVAPLPGDYRVRVLAFTAGDQFTVKDAGTDTTDSDINPTGTNAGFTDIYTFGSNLISITSIDAGLSFVQLTPTPSATPTNTPTPHPANAAPIRNYDSNSVVHFTWVGVDWAVGYELEVDNNANFSSPEYANRTMDSTFDGLWVILPSGEGVYYWRVGAKASNGTIRWSASQSFTINLP